LGWHRDWFAPRRHSYSPGRTYTNVRCARCYCLDCAAHAPAGNRPDRLDRCPGSSGFCFAGMFIVVESWLNGAATAETRGQVLSIYSMTGLIAGVAGQLLFPSTDPAGFRPFCIIASIIAVSLVPITLTRMASAKRWQAINSFRPEQGPLVVEDVACLAGKACGFSVCSAATSVC
jgi:MFS family permease